VKTYFDSSAFAKRFVEEAGADEVEKLCLQTTVLCLGVIAVPEIISALNRRKREQTLTGKQYAESKQRLAADINDAEVVYLNEAIIRKSISVLEKNSIQTLDALHIACALECGAKLFVSADLKQLKAAKHSGLPTRQV
jgi:predicted nucleic acid-binding protein